MFDIKWYIQHQSCWYSTHARWPGGFKLQGFLWSQGDKLRSVASKAMLKLPCLTLILQCVFTVCLLLCVTTGASSLYSQNWIKQLHFFSSKTPKIDQSKLDSQQWRTPSTRPEVNQSLTGSCFWFKFTGDPSNSSEPRPTVWLYSHISHST